MHLLYARHRAGIQPWVGDTTVNKRLHTATLEVLCQADRHIRIGVTSNMVGGKEWARLSARLGIRKGFGAGGGKVGRRAWGS